MNSEYNKVELESGKGRLLTPISKEEYVDCRRGVPIHKHWHVDGEIVELYIIDEKEENLQGNLRDYVSASTSQSSHISVIPLNRIDWDTFVKNGKKSNALFTPENASEDQFQFMLFPEKFKENFYQKKEAR